MRFRKKPVEIEAVLWDGKNFDEVCRFAGLTNVSRDMYSGELKIATLEGVMTASQYDWIIKGVAGEFYPCKPDIFEKTYERA